MFSDYSYNTLKYCGLPDFFTSKIKMAPCERKFLETHKLETTIVETPICVIKTCKNIIYSAIIKDAKKFGGTRIRTWLDETCKNKRYIDDILLEYNGTNAVEKLVPFTMKQLQVLVKKNHGTVKGDKRIKLSWVYAYIDTILLGFNTFAVRSNLNGDILREIRKFL